MNEALTTLWTQGESNTGLLAARGIGYNRMYG